MKLEFNLVNNNGNSFSSIFSLLTRKREFVDEATTSTTDVLDLASKFLAENLDSISSVITNKELESYLSGTPKMTLADLNSVKYALSASGVDLIIYALDDNESANVNSIPAKEYEQCVLNKNDFRFGFVPTVDKIIGKVEDANFSKVYSLIQKKYEPFKKEVVGPDNYLTPYIKTLESSEKMLGKTDSMTSTYVNSVLEYLGFSTQVIVNE